MSFFSPDYIRFFEELTKNNNQEWFNHNRKLYDEAVRMPFAAFTREMIRRIQRYEPNLDLSPSEAIFRINKDVNRPEDGGPYRTHMSANIAPQGADTRNQPGFYFQFGPNKGVIAGGIYFLDNDTLARIRSEVAWHGDEFQQLLNAAEFNSKFGNIQGEKNKELPADLKEASAQQPLIANRQFYYVAEIPAELIMHDSLADVIMEFYKAGKPINDFLRRAVPAEPNNPDFNPLKLGKGIV